MKIPPVEAELIRGDWRMNRQTEAANTRYQRFCERAKETSQVILYEEISVVCSRNRTKCINTLCVQNVEYSTVNILVHK